MEWKCKHCLYYVTSSVAKTVTKTGRDNYTTIVKFCSYKREFRTENDDICSYFVTYGTVRCNSNDKEVSFADCIKCRQCEVSTFLENNVKLYKGKNREEVRKNIMANVQDVRVVIETAINELNKTGLTKSIIINKSPLKMTEEELVKLVNSFLDAVESIPYDKEKFIPEFVVNVYNKIVDNELVVISDEFDGVRTSVSDDILLLRRTKIPSVENY